MANTKRKPAHLRREKIINLAMRESEVELLNAAAERSGLNRSAIIRLGSMKEARKLIRD